MIEEFTKIKTKTWDWTKAVPTRRRPKQPPKSGRGKKRIRTESKVETSFLEERQEAETGHTRTCRATKKKGDTYEAGFVDEIKRNETTSEVLYVVRIGEGTVEEARTIRCSRHRPTASGAARQTRRSYRRWTKRPTRVVAKRVRGRRGVNPATKSKFGISHTKPTARTSDHVDLDQCLDIVQSKPPERRPTHRLQDKPLLQVQQRMLRSPSRPTFFRPRRPDMPLFSRQWFVCFPASCVSATRLRSGRSSSQQCPRSEESSSWQWFVRVPAAARVSATRPCSGGPSSLYGGLPVEFWLRGLLPPRHLQLFYLRCYIQLSTNGGKLCT
ncbi:conserved hypothetical protein [Culex quinquefasciatus]|uniref:Uncharacterized protein n=1 Tax=Culex quinquefasciatus TaxID=7176 RepID=B0XEK4_CULQU|nr:conserved hypothetical protein [Culex quinquefasciatus]|eukprot:XP_001868076.1 conserved hypothetical protein [Culex quinquefasciatus]